MSEPQPVVPPTVGARIAQGRRFLGWLEGRDITPVDLAERVGVTAQSVYNWENDVSPPGEKNLDRLATVLRMTKAYLRYGATEGSGRLAMMLRLHRIFEDAAAEDPGLADALVGGRAQPTQEELQQQALERIKRKDLPSPQEVQRAAGTTAKKDPARRRSSGGGRRA